MRAITMLLLLTLAACAGGGEARDAEGQEAAESASSETVAVRPGVDVLLDSVPESLRGRRVGLVTNHTGRDAAGRSTIDRLAESGAMELVALYAPEHGIRGAAAPGEHISAEVDEKTGLPIHSLYGETRKPTPDMLEGVEALLFDIQDVGVRQYTYISTMKLAMEAAAEAGIPFVVLDRPNPIGGRIVEGNILEEEFESFVGTHPIPVRHGMTVGELALMFDAEDSMGVNLAVIPVEGWRRAMWWDETGLEWVNPSPNIRRLEAAIHYPGTVFWEATNLSEGRGTEMPFEQTGAPWLRAGEVTDSLNALGLAGVRFEALPLQVEAGAAKFPGATLEGLRYVVTDREAYRPVETTLRAIGLTRRMHPDHFEWRAADRGPRGMPLTVHGGSVRLFEAYRDGTLDALLTDWREDARQFMERRREYLLYE